MKIDQKVYVFLMENFLTLTQCIFELIVCNIYDEAWRDILHINLKSRN